MVLRADDPAYLRLLVDEGQNEAWRHLGSTPDMQAKYRGPFFVNGPENGERNTYTPENIYFEYVSSIVPRLVMHNPRVRVQSRRSGPQEEVAVAMRHGLNRINRDLKLNVTLRDLAVDMLFAWGVAIVRENPREGVILSEDDPIYPATPTWPSVERIPPAKAFWDPEAYDWESTRYRGHEWRMDRDDLIRRAKDNPKEKWDLDAIKDLATDTREEYQGYLPTDDQRREVKVPRWEVRAVDVWVPGFELPDSPGVSEGFHGTVFTLGMQSAPKDEGLTLYDHNGEKISSKQNRQGFLRPPRPFYGPATGPYTLFGCYRVPDSPFPLSPLIAMEGQIRDLNEQTQAAIRSQQKYKRFIAVPDRNTAEKVKKTMHNGVVVIPESASGGKLMFETAEVGGTSPTQYEGIAWSSERVKTGLGMDETFTGNASRGDTATATTLANEGAMARLSEIEAAFTRGATDIEYSLAHFMYYSDTVVFPLGEEVFEEDDIQLPDYPGLEVEPWFRGGDHDPSSGYTFEDLELEIEPFSMPRTSPQLEQQRMLQAHAMILESLPAIAQFPDFPWKEHFQKLGEAMNMPNLEELISKEMLERLSKQLEMAMQVEANPQMAAPQGARFGQHVGGPAGSQASQGAGPATASRVQGRGMPGLQKASQGAQPKPKGPKAAVA